MRMIWIALGVLAAALASIAPAAAQNTTGLVVSVCGSPASPFVAGRPAPFTVDTTGTLCDAGGGGGGGSAVPFTPNGNFGTLTATAASSASTAMPAGATVALQNTSTVDVSCVLSSGAATATTNKIVVRGGATVFVAVGSNINAACINQTGVASNVVVMAGGAGLGTNFGGGGGGSSGGGTSSSFDAAFPATGTAVGLSDGTNMKSWLTALIQTKTAVNGNNMGSVANWLWNGASFDAATGTAALGANVQAKSGAFASGSVASGAMVDLGAIADAASTAGGAGSVNAKLRLMTTQLDTLNTNVTLSIPAGTNLIGDVNLRQGGTALSTTNGAYFNQLQGNAVLSATNPSFSRPTDGTSARVFDPCEVVAHVPTPISISSAATSVIVAGTSAKKTYICSMMLMSAGTTNVGIVQGSGSTCSTSTLGLIGGATAATGPNLTAQAGFVAGNGNFAIAGTTVNANDICLINGSAIQVSGYIVTATP